MALQEQSFQLHLPSVHVDTFDCLIVIVSDRDGNPDRYRITASDQPDAIIVHVMLLSSTLRR